MKKIDNYNLICPVCKNSLSKNKEGLLFCYFEKCNQFRKIIYLINKKPILINFKKSLFSKSNLIDSSGSSILERNTIKNKMFKFLKIILNGSNNKTKQNFSNIIKKLKKISNPRILIVGGGSLGVGVDLFYKNFKDNILSFDVYDSIYVDFIADATSIPLKDKSFDFVLIQAVLEHVHNPNLVVNEIYRILKNNGLVYAETPFLQHVHEGAYDFTRFTVLGHRMLFKKFEKISIGHIGGLGQSLIWSIEFFARSFFRSKKIGKLFKLIFFWFRILENLIPDSYNEDGACGAYFYGFKETNNKAKPIIQYLNDYQGNQK
jgi:SAM-dependent methyltransferase